MAGGKTAALLALLRGGGQGRGRLRVLEAAPDDDLAPPELPASRHPGWQRTPPPAPVQDAEELQILKGDVTDKMKERMQQLRYLQDFFHNPVPFDLREKKLPTSSTPEELAARVAEVEYQIHVLNALIQVLGEEAEELHRAMGAEPAAAAE